MRTGTGRYFVAGMIGAIFYGVSLAVVYFAGILTGDYISDVAAKNQTPKHSGRYPWGKDTCQSKPDLQEVK